MRSREPVGLLDGLTRRLGGLLAVLVVGVVALRWALDLLTSARYFWVFVVVVVGFLLWRVGLFFYRRRL